jgi:lipoprotein-anchoring transpeptidase ErfK/SrfK
MTNEDIIDLYSRVQIGTIVVVLHQGERVASAQ